MNIIAKSKLNILTGAVAIVLSFSSTPSMAGSHDYKHGKGQASYVDVSEVHYDRHNRHVYGHRHRKHNKHRNYVMNQHKHKNHYHRHHQRDYYSSGFIIGLHNNFGFIFRD